MGAAGSAALPSVGSPTTLTARPDGAAPHPARAPAAREEQAERGRDAAVGPGRRNAVEIVEKAVERPDWIGHRSDGENLGQSGSWQDHDRPTLSIGKCCAAK